MPITIPQLGLVEAVILLEWLVPSGASVAEGTPVLLVETEKAEVEIVSPATGIILVSVPAGDEEVAVGTQVGHVEVL
jgi:pyruvate/2-oxoglutarate dehydrogenase complex dihydrolipoamide acyltransferase (E2) component